MTSSAGPIHFSIFPDPASYPLSIGLLVQKWKIDFQDGDHSGHLDFWSEWFQLFLIYKLSICLSVQESKGKTAMAAILDFRLEWYKYFWSTSHPDIPYKVSRQLAFWFRRRSAKWIFKMAYMVAILDFRSENFTYFWSASCPDFLPSFESAGLLVQETKSKTGLQDCRMVAILDFRSEQF